MKLRLKNNNLKLKISAKELETFSSENQLHAEIDFYNGTVLSFKLISRQIGKPTAEFSENCINIYFPENKIATFKNTALPYIDNHPVESGKTYIRIEKDFTQTQQGKAEKDNNAFPNPLHIDLVD